MSRSGRTGVAGLAPGALQRRVIEPINGRIVVRHHVPSMSNVT
jgi:hypothetical protein